MARETSTSSKLQKTKLSNNAKKVLCALVSDPESRNRGVGEKTSLNTSTVSTIKQRLGDGGIIRIRRIPVFFTLENRTKFAMTGRYRFHLPPDARKTMSELSALDSTPFYHLSNELFWMSFTLSSDEAGEMENLSKRLKDRYSKGMLYDVVRSQFDESDIKLWKYFDYGPLLQNCFKFPLSDGAIGGYKPWSMNLDESEMLVLESLVKEPELTDYKRSQKLPLSHPTCKKIRESLLEKGILKTVVEPDLLALGFKLTAWFRVKYTGGKFPTEVAKSLARHPECILCVQDSSSVFMLSVFKDISDMMNGQKKIGNSLPGDMFSLVDMSYNFFSLEDESTMKDMDSLGSIRMVMGLAEEEISLPEGDEDSSLSLVAQLLEGHIPQERATSIVNEARKNLGFGDVETLDEVAKVMLELLTEPSYLSVLEDVERTTIQLRLVEELKRVRTPSAEISDTTQSSHVGVVPRVLIVDGSEPTGRMLKETLENALVSVVDVVSIEEDAVERYMQFYADGKGPLLVLMDIFLRKGSGPEATKRIREHDPNASIMVLTSSLNSKVKSTMMSLGVDEYLVKPVAGEQLVDEIFKMWVKKRDSTS